MFFCDLNELWCFLGSIQTTEKVQKTEGCRRAARWGVQGSLHSAGIWQVRFYGTCACVSQDTCVSHGTCLHTNIEKTLILLTVWTRQPHWDHCAYYAQWLADRTSRQQQGRSLYYSYTMLWDVQTFIRICKWHQCSQCSNVVFKPPQNVSTMY